VVTLQPGASLSAQELLAYCEPKMATFALPRYVEFLEELPKTQATARIEKYKLRQEWRTPTTWDRSSGGFLP
jgi:crotonobetaine/carnitine-CoA ligase